MKIFTGKVISKSLSKTVKIGVDRVVTHRVYNKRVKRTKKYRVHDELGAQIGQVVRFVASKPYSKTKKWKVIEIVNEKVDTQAPKSERPQAINRVKKAALSSRKPNNRRKGGK